MKCAIAIVAAGAFSGQIVDKLSNVQTENGLEKIYLPVEPR